MTRPVRNRRGPKRFEVEAEEREKSPVIKDVKKATRSGGGGSPSSSSRKNLRSPSETTKKRSSPLKDKTNIGKEKTRRQSDRDESGGETEVKIDKNGGQSRKLRDRPKAEKDLGGKSLKSGNKFFKSKKPFQAEVEEIGPRKVRKLRKETGRKESLGFVSALRQTTLSESFTRGTVMARLRPRKAAKEYKDASNFSVQLEKSVSPDKRNSVVVLERIDPSKTNRKPVYKTLVTQNEEDDKESIYDFRFDSNDVTEKPKKKKKRVRKAVLRKKKSIALLKPKPKSNANPSESEKKQTETLVSEANPQREFRIKDEAVHAPETVAEPEKDENAPPQDEKVEERSPRLRICSVEKLTGDKKVSFKTKRNPFSSTQSIFGPRPTLNLKEMIDHSLLNKSLSPIKGTERQDPFDAASPWRPAVSESFFKLKQVVQSTPQIRRNFGRPSSPPRGSGIKENGENRNLGLPKSPRPLGVRTSNVENIQASNPRKTVALVHAEPKQNLHPGFGDRLYKSPKKTVLCAINEAPPSPLQKVDENTPPMEESRLLKQSNLNSFLNIDEMPESIKISTSHGIFGDAHSTPVVKTQGSRVPQQDGAENFFGFDDEDVSSEAQVSPIRTDKKQRTTPVKKIFKRLKERIFLPKEKNPARISLGEIKNTLYPRKEKKPNNLAPKKEEEAKSCNNNEKTEVAIKGTEAASNAIQFSDTFDVMSEKGDGNNAENSMGPEIALFADIEPVHFTKPARWSYSKKRDRRQYWSSEDEDEDILIDTHKVPVLKKRRLAKVNKLEEKKIEDWVKSVNETFQEIEDFDLVVEKLP